MKQHSWTRVILNCWSLCVQKNYKRRYSAFWLLWSILLIYKAYAQKLFNQVTKQIVEKSHNLMILWLLAFLLSCSFVNCCVFCQKLHPPHSETVVWCIRGGINSCLATTETEAGGLSPGTPGQPWQCRKTLSPKVTPPLNHVSLSFLEL